MMTTTTNSSGPLSLERLGSAPTTRALLPGCNAPLERFLRLADVNRIYHGIRAQDPLAFVAQALDTLDIGADVSATDLSRIPKDGPAVVVANHPYGILDGLLLAHLLGSVRRDLRILATRELAVFPELRDLLIMVDPGGQASHRGENLRGLRQALGWVREGGMLVVFPSGLISRPALVHGHHQVVDP